MGVGLDSIRVLGGRKILVLGATAVAAIAVAACGSDEGKIDQQTARQMLAQLGDARILFAEEDCTGARDATAELSSQVSTLDDGVDAALRNALTEGAENLTTLIDNSALCIEADAIEPEPVIPEPPPVEPTVPEPPPVEPTVPEPPTTTPDDPTTPTDPTTPDPGDGTGGTGGTSQ